MGNFETRYSLISVFLKEQGLWQGAPARTLPSLLWQRNEGHPIWLSTVSLWFGWAQWSHCDSQAHSVHLADPHGTPLTREQLQVPRYSQ